MIDVEMFEELGRPIVSGPQAPGYRLPISLEDVFAKVVVDGWQPRNPAFVRDLDGLELSTIRGTCLNPLLFEGDEVFVDRNMPPLAGDLVSFALSERGAAAQNSNLPAGKSPVRRGDFWLKLYAPYRGYEMLLENRASATATLLNCEHPDDSPILHPVRNVRRNGRLLFTPDSYCAQIGDNAVSQIASALNTVSSSCVTNASSPVSFVAPAVSAAVISTGNPLSIDISGSYQTTIAGGATLSSVKLFITVNGVQLSSGGFFLDNSGNPNANPIQFTIVATDTQAAGTVCTYGLMGTIAGTTGSLSHVQLQCFNPYIKIRDYKK